MQDYEVIIIGGGPAGCSAATVLAMHGRRVVVLEREKFPRYHVGESMMPYCWFPLERLGVVDKISNSHFVKKYSVQFVRQNGQVTQPFYFFQHYDHPSSTTWQVLRSELDQILMDNAREKGAEVREETRVNEIISDGNRAVGVRAVAKDGSAYELRAPMIIDATGRDALTISRRGWRVMDEKLRKIAIWTYYRGARW
jgi:flavin-dependent dehydrogenase